MQFLKFCNKKSEESNLKILENRQHFWLVIVITRFMKITCTIMYFWAYITLKQDSSRYLVQKNQKLTLSYTCLKWMFIAGWKKLLLYSSVDFFWIIWTKCSKESQFWRRLGKFCYDHQFFKTFLTGCEKFVVVKITWLVLK